MTSLDGLRALLAKATPGPWHKNSPGCVVANADGWIAYPYRTDSEAYANAALIVAAVNALPDLLTELEDARRRLAVPIPADVEALGTRLRDTAGWIGQQSGISWTGFPLIAKDCAEAAAMLRSLASRIAELEAAHDRVKAEREVYRAALGRIAMEADDDCRNRDDADALVSIARAAIARTP